ncbi:MAG: hypothetical protein P4L79_10005 [Legionella sp.]|uniref:hypothetical protein n=1 Tax=Legionella sp. TaxID=459 RepID=UPI002846D85A|nr:hypothetical protein [Legionella sp.]
MTEGRFAREGTIWVCAACGKTHKDRYGMEGEGSRGWDESCMMHAVLCDEKQRPDLNGQMMFWCAEDQPHD